MEETRMRVEFVVGRSPLGNAVEGVESVLRMFKEDLTELDMARALRMIAETMEGRAG